jgi:hypothetical protein
MTQKERNLEKFGRYVMNDIPMRLIRLSDMSLVSRDDVREHFRGSVIKEALYNPLYHVRYAILSHRWLLHGEPTYEEMKAGTATGPGYEKLKMFCEKARECRLEFAWSDTCCIDKSSNSEVDQSIRSMFRWYKNSAICIVHLAQSQTIEDIMDDEWTTRGWTLQELLAPDKIKFFNEDWIPMTDSRNDKSYSKTDIMEFLERATGVPHDNLFRFSPGPHKVDTRMAWAARRETTRAEDLAYSLMGIFNVSMQIAYGEGGESAFCRLIEAIVQSGDPSVLNWRGDPANHRTSRAIPRSPQSFLGRRELKLDGVHLEMTMTNLGLRVPLVMFPLNFHSAQDVGGGYAFTLECPLCTTITLDIVNAPSSVTSSHQYAVGILNYSIFEDRSREVLGIRGKSVGFILSRTRDQFYSPRRARPVVVDTVAPPKHKFGQWRIALFQAGLVEVNFPTILSSSMFYMNRKYLKIVYL